MAHHTGGAGVPQEDHLRPRGFPAGVPEGRSGAVQTAGEASTGNHRQGVPGAAHRGRVPGKHQGVPQGLQRIQLGNI